MTIATDPRPPSAQLTSAARRSTMTYSVLFSDTFDLCRKMRQPYRPTDITNYRGQWGANLRRLRVQVFTTQLEFAIALSNEAVFVHKNTVSNWELGTRTPPIEVLPAIARVLKCKIWELVPEYIPTGDDVESSRYDMKDEDHPLRQHKGRKRRRG